jgi:hypothetical protein
VNDPWPPAAPKIREDFKKAQEAKNDNLPQPAPQAPVTKKEIEDLESQRKRPAPQLNLTPPGARPQGSAEQERNARIEKMKQRLREKNGKAREDFGRSAGREM